MTFNLEKDGLYTIRIDQGSDDGGFIYHEENGIEEKIPEIGKNPVLKKNSLTMYDRERRLVALLNFDGNMTIRTKKKLIFFSGFIPFEEKEQFK